MDFIKKYWLVLIGLIIALPLAYKYIMKQISTIDTQRQENEQQKSSDENALDSPKIQQEKSKEVVKKHVKKKIDPKVLDRLNKNAHQIAYNLGTLPSQNWLDKATENDAEVGRLLKVESRNLTIIADLYYSVYTESRNLRSDLLKLLDNDVKDDYRAYCKRNKINPFF